QFFNGNVLAEKTTINILMRLPDLTENLQPEEYQIFYEEDGSFDLMIIDERSLFVDISFMETYYMELGFGRNPSKQHILNLSKYIDPELLKFHDPKILKDGYINDDLYALPYETDFDLLYYRPKDTISQNLVKKMESVNWDEMVYQIMEIDNYPLEMAISHDNDLFNFFFEYTSNKYNLTKAYDPNYFKVFYNDTANDIFDSFFNVVATYTNNTIDSALFLPYEDALLNFINGESIFFRGKASHHHLFSSLSDDTMENTEEINTESNFSFASTLPPKYISAKFNKYLIVNKHSEVDKDLLIDVALELTSKNMQLYRANNLGNIPTFDFSSFSTTDINSNTNQ
ncbi:hypothetical protein PIROE2DRAFT_65300, partial [Piromyces sp. E2]